MTAPIEPLRPRGHVVVVHRWQDHYANYDNYIDHSLHPVTYVTTPVGRASLPVSAAAVVELERTDNLDALRAAVSRLSGMFGPPTAIVALKEGDLPTVAQLRAEYDTPGPRPEGLQPFLDKLKMAELLQRHGTPQPAFAAIEGPDDVLRFAHEHGWPVIVKPRRGSASQGVVKVDDEEGLARVPFEEGRPRMVQEFLDHQILHVDGMCADGAVGTWRASKYINTCLSFVNGTYLGSVEVDDPALLEAVDTFIQGLIPKLTQQPWIFHLELFTTRKSQGWQCMFLEVGRRVGGAEIPWVWREVHGIELLAAECALQLGQLPFLAPLTRGEPIAGYLLTPPPAQRPCLVTGTRSMVGAGGPYAEKVIASGNCIPDADAFYEHTAGRFRFRGSTTKQVETAIRDTASGFAYQYDPIEPVVK